jgi:hypothetical protein
MDHSEAVSQMAAERYLLDELASDARQAFEEHLFDCPECALDLRAGAAFVQEAKAQLPELTANPPAPIPTGFRKPKVERQGWFTWWRPSIAAPAFASLLILLGYQNLVTFPALRAAASQPRLVPWTPMRGATRGGPSLTVTADREHGVALLIDLAQQPGTANFASFSFELFDPQERLAWTGVADASGGQPLSLVIPGTKLRSGAYTVAVYGIGPNGERTAIDKYVFDLRLTD